MPARPSPGRRSRRRSATGGWATPPRGKFFTANTKRELIEAFRKATARQPLHLRAHEPGSRKAIALTRDRLTDLALTRVQDNLNLSRVLTPGSYVVRVPLLPPQDIR